MTMQNLQAMFRLADAVEGIVAYERYHVVMHDLAMLYGFRLSAVVAVFCALSPNNDYDNNLRSCVSVLRGMREGWSVDDVEVSTYRHCLLRAWQYANGTDFLDAAKGLKIRNFYMNVLYPDDNRYVTIDGHMVAIWRGQNLTMKEAICKGQREYNAIADAVKGMAFTYFMLPNQLQAVLWFVRKRVLNVKAGNASQYDLLMPNDLDMWRTHRDVRTIKPFPRRIRIPTDPNGVKDRADGQDEQAGPSGVQGVWRGWGDCID
jgi:hypothetical protein